MLHDACTAGSVLPEQANMFMECVRNVYSMKPSLPFGSICFRVEPEPYM
jgi:hypothetical protein